MTGGKNQAIQVIPITSPSVGDGKTTTASNLAIGLAKAGGRVLLIDADIRRPSRPLRALLPPTSDRTG